MVSSDKISPYKGSESDPERHPGNSVFCLKKGPGSQKVWPGPFWAKFHNVTRKKKSIF